MSFVSLVELFKKWVIINSKSTDKAKKAINIHEKGKLKFSSFLTILKYRDIKGIITGNNNRSSK